MDLAPKSIKATSDASKPPNIEGSTTAKTMTQVHTRPPRPLSAGQITPGQQTIIKQVNLTASRQNAPLHTTTSYHVPRGAAAVANIAAPRATALATPIVRATSTLQASNNFISTGLRAIGPRSNVSVPTAGVLTSNIPGTWAQSTSRTGHVTVTGRPLTLQPATKQAQILQPIGSTKSITFNQGHAQLQNLPKATAVTTVRPLNAPLVRPLSTPSASVGSLVTKTTVPVCNVNIGVSNIVSSAPTLNTMQATQLTRLTVTSGTPIVSLQQVGLPIKAATGTTLSAVPGTPAATAAAAGLKTVPIKSLPIKAISQLPSSTARAIQHAIGPKVIAQPSHGPIQVTQIPVNKVGGQMLLSSAHRGNVPLTTTSVSASVNKAPVNFPSSTAEQQVSPVSTSVYIQPRASPAPSGQTTTAFATVPSYLYETSAGTSYQVGTAGSLVSRPFPTTTTLAPSVVATPAPIRPSPGPTTTHQVHGLVTASFNPVMVVDSSRGAAVPLPQYMAEVLEKQLSSGTLVQADAATVAAATAAVQTQTLVQASGPAQALVPSCVTTTPASPASSSSLQTSVASKLNASPRPSILRKRDNEGSPLKAQKNLSNMLAVLAATPSPQSPPSPPRRPDSRSGTGGNGGNGGGHSSAGSTTISATSSPGLGDSIVGEDSLPPSIIKNIDNLPLVEMSPRKKPRKQQFANEINEAKFSDEEMEFISEEKLKKDIKDESENSSNLSNHPGNTTMSSGKPSYISSSTINPSPIHEPIILPARRPTPQLIKTYKHSWKSRNNHFLRYSDIKPKDERRSNLTELANQKNIMQKLDGWKVHHLSNQMDDMVESESDARERLLATLKIMERKSTKDIDKDINRVNELIKGNMQRSKVLSDQIIEARTQVMKIFDHKPHVSDIIGRCASKRPYKKSR